MSASVRGRKEFSDSFRLCQMLGCVYEGVTSSFGRCDLTQQWLHSQPSSSRLETERNRVSQSIAMGVRPGRSQMCGPVLTTCVQSSRGVTSTGIKRDVYGEEPWCSHSITDLVVSHTDGAYKHRGLRRGRN